MLRKKSERYLKTLVVAEIERQVLREMLAKIELETEVSDAFRKRMRHILTQELTSLGEKT